MNVTLWVYVTIVAAAIFMVAMLARDECYRQYDAYGTVKWGPVDGCMIQTKSGQWEQAENYLKLPHD